VSVNGAKAIMQKKQGVEEKVETGLVQELDDLRRRVAHLEQAERKKITEESDESKQIFKTIFDNAADGIVLADVEKKKFYMANKMFCQLLGYNSQEIKKLGVMDIHPEGDLSYVVEQFEKQVRGEFTLSKDIPVKKKDGCVFFADVNSFPIKLDGKKYLMGIFRDITERRKAEEEVRKLSSAVEQSIDGIAICDLESKLVYFNTAYAQMHGYTPKEMFRMPIAKLYSKKEVGKLRKVINQTKTQGFWKGELGHIRKDRTAFLTYMSITLLKNKEGKPTGTLAIARDITETKRSEEELDIYRNNTIRAEEFAAVGTLSATVANDLTQPLTIIGLSFENSLVALKKIPCPQTVIEDLNEGLSEISNVISIVDRFRNFAMRSSNSTFVEVDFKEIAERTVELLSVSAWRAKVSLWVEGLDKLPLIYSHKRDLKRLFYSLTENAIQAADGKKKYQVVISGVVREGQIELKFSDNCGGIAPENLNKIFRPFFTTKTAEHGTGLGLCVVEHIVSKLRGDVRVESTLGKGSTFFVTLPTGLVDK
jgi:PAS domain S-box-containing protein